MKWLTIVKTNSIRCWFAPCELLLTEAHTVLLWILKTCSLFWWNFFFSFNEFCIPTITVTIICIHQVSVYESKYETSFCIIAKAIMKVINSSPRNHIRWKFKIQKICFISHAFEWVDLTAVYVCIHSHGFIWKWYTVAPFNFKCEIKLKGAMWIQTMLNKIAMKAKWNKWRT